MKMKTNQTTALLLCLVALCATGCKKPATRNALATGDLIFVGIPWNYEVEDTASMTSAIVAATGDDSLNMIHVAIAEVEGDSIWIIDATLRHGVDRHPLDTFLADFTLRDGSLPVFVVKRLTDCRAEAFVENAKAFVGEPYDMSFLPDNGAKYCSELVYDSYVTPEGVHLFQSAPMNFKNPDGEMPVYWTWLFSLLNMEVPQDVLGTNPQDMGKSAVLENVQVVFP